MEFPAQPTSSDASGNVEAASSGRPARNGVGCIAVLIAAVAVLFLSFVGIIYYNSWLRQDPKGLLIIEGGPEHAGVHVRVAAVGAEPFEAVLSAAEQYTIRRGLNTGVYSLRVWQGDVVLYQRAAFDVKEHQVVKLTLGRSPAASRPAVR